MDLEEAFRERKEALFSDLRKAITFVPDRERDIVAFMKSYLNAEPDDRYHILDNLLKCINGQEYPNPREDYVSYDETDIQALSESITQFFTGLELTNGNEIEIKKCVSAVVKTVNELNESCGKSMMDTWRREELCGIINGAAELAGVTSQEDMTYDMRMW
jgi:formylmethanofuran dehydrogenase subunit B